MIRPNVKVGNSVEQSKRILRNPSFCQTAARPAPSQAILGPVAVNGYFITGVRSPQPSSQRTERAFRCGSLAKGLRERQESLEREKSFPDYSSTKGFRPWAASRAVMRAPPLSRSRRECPRWASPPARPQVPHSHRIPTCFASH